MGFEMGGGARTRAQITGRVSRKWIVGGSVCSPASVSSAATDEERWWKWWKLGRSSNIDKVE